MFLQGHGLLIYLFVDIALSFDWATVFLTGGSVLALEGHTYCCTFASSLFSTSIFFDTSSVIFWAVVESLLLSYSYNLCCNYHTVTRQAEVALPLSVSILKSLFSTMTIGSLPYAMPRGQVLEVSTSRNAYMAHTRSRSL